MRPSAAELIKHPLFDEVRSEQYEVQAAHKFRLDIDSDDNYDYQASMFKVSTATLLKTIIMKIEEYNK